MTLASCFEEVCLDYVTSDRCTHIRLLTEDQEDVAYTKVIRDGWTTLEDGTLRLGGVVCRGNDVPLVGQLVPNASIRSVPINYPRDCAGVSARLNPNPGDDTVRLTVYWDESIMAIAFPLWDWLDDD